MFTFMNSGWSAMCGRTADSLVLVKFNQSTNGSNWFTKWQFNQPINTWYGVTLNSNGCVTHINLNNNNLTGSLPDEIGMLGSLKRLFLFTNSIAGVLPSSIGDLIELEELNLEGNLISGAIPNTISNLNKLNFISLAVNQLQSNIPSGIFTLVNLIQLRLNGNSFSGNIPNDVMYLTKVQILDLSENKLIGVVPSGIGLCKSLQDLLLNDNMLSGELPSTMSNLTNIFNLWLQNNQFVGLVPDLRSAPLNSLRIENNYFTSIPDYSTVKTLGRTDPFGLVMYNNYFTYEDLIPLLALPRAVNWNFKPQRPIRVDSIQYVQYGGNYPIRIFTDPGLLENNYKWFKDTQVLTITNQNFFQILNMSESQEGYYSGSIVNQQFPEFNIAVLPIRIVGFNPGKCDEPLAGKNCTDAPGFCNTGDLHSYCGNMNLKDEIVRSSFCNIVDNLENPRFIKFTASSDSVVLEIFPISCDHVRINEVDYSGLQAAIVKSCDTGQVNSLYCQNECQIAPFKLGGSGFVKGEEYTLVIDGCQGSVCNYLIKVVAGRNYFTLIPESTLIGEQTFCPDTNDHYFTINAISGAKEYVWSINDTIYKSNTDTFFNVKNSRSGIFKISVVATANCDTTNEISKTFRIFPKMSINSINTEKNSNDSIYKVKFKITGGTPPYFLNSGAGLLDSLEGFFESSTQFCKKPYYFEVKDKFNCSIVITGLEKCSCDSEAGTMPSNIYTICGQDNIIAKNNNDGFRDTGDVAQYIICYDSTKPFTSIIRTSQSGVIPFDISKFKFDSIYFLCYAVGRSSGLNQLNYTHPCLSISNFQPVVFRRKTLVSAGPDKSICTNSTQLIASGNFIKARWIKISGPDGIMIEYPDSSETNISFDSIGSYIIKLEANNNYCISQDEIRINYDTVYRPIITGVTSICGGKETSLDVGDQVSYKWSTGDTTRSIKVSQSGRYCVYVVNSGNCEGDTCVDVKISPNPIFLIQGNTKICNGSTSTLQSDNDFAQYLWSTTATSKSIIIDKAGTYCLTVTNGDGCTATQCVNVSNISNTSSTKVDSSCNRSLYVFNGKLYDVPGSYLITLKGANAQGCDSIITLNLYSYPPIMIRDSFVIPDYGNNSGSISLTFNGGVRPLKFKWSNNATSQSLVDVSFGTYTVTVTDNKNCNAEYTFVIKNSVGIDQIQSSERPILYPNPIHKNQILIWNTKTSSESWSIQIMNQQGQQAINPIFIANGTDKNIIPTQLSSGIYTVISTNRIGKRFYQKLVILD